MINFINILKICANRILAADDCVLCVTHVGKLMPVTQENSEKT